MKTCYVERGYYYGAEYRYIDWRTGEESRWFSNEGQCIDAAKEKGYKIQNQKELNTKTHWEEK